MLPAFPEAAPFELASLKDHFAQRTEWSFGKYMELFSSHRSQGIDRVLKLRALKQACGKWRKRSKNKPRYIRGMVDIVADKKNIPIHFELTDFLHSVNFCKTKRNIMGLKRRSL
jgi:hypothetical protein